jgi:hypothetical protein
LLYFVRPTGGRKLSGVFVRFRAPLICWLKVDVGHACIFCCQNLPGLGPLVQQDHTSVVLVIPGTVAPGFLLQHL